MAGVSVTTVSRVLNKHPYVSKEKKNAVLDWVKQMTNPPTALLVTSDEVAAGIVICAQNRNISGSSECNNGVVCLPEVYEMNTPIVFFVIDGTLLNEDKIIPNSTKKVVRLLQEKGIHTVIATGRVPKMIYSLQDGALHIKKSYDPTAICN